LIVEDKSKDKKAFSLRKRPVQQRSKITIGALQEAFVRVLIDRGYEKITIREVTAVAGVGIGSFYDYAPNLRALAASVIQKRCLDTVILLRQSLLGKEGRPFSELADLLLQALIKEGFGRPKEWTALLLLERQVSSAAALKQVHGEFVSIWAEAIQMSAANVPSAKIISMARMAHAISYGWYSHDLLFYMDDPITSRSMADIAKAITHFIESASI
jgi:AcrR family transcriptional regulator